MPADDAEELSNSQRALSQVVKTAEPSVQLDGAELLVLSDRTAYEGERPFLDPHVVLSAIDGAPSSARNSVVLPEPEGPSRHTYAPSGMTRSMPRRASIDPNRL